jgi:long-chain acyl-CoA synthetase
VVEEEVSGRPCRVYRHRRHNVADLVEDLARWGDRITLGQGDRRISYTQHVAAIDTVAAHLITAGLAPGGRVVLLGDNSPEWVTAFWAIFRAGGVAVPCNTWWSAPEVEHALGVISSDLVLADERRAALVPAGHRVIHLNIVREIVDRCSRTGMTVSPPVLHTTPVAEDDPAMILFTSGTVGAAKAVRLSQRSVIANIHNLLARTNRLPTELTSEHAGTVSLMCLPLFHIGGLQTLIGGQLSGGRLLFLDDRFDPVAVLRLIEKEKIRFFGGVPTMVARLLDEPRLAEFDTSSLVSIAMGGSVVVPEFAERIARGFPSANRRITSVYGQTEAGGALTSANGTDLLDRPGCVGKPLPVADIRISNPDAEGIGEVIARSPTMMSGFVATDDPSTSPIDDEGWLHTGDLGRFDPDGYLYIVGRAKDIIIRGGENIAPGHIENALLQHPDVATVAVVGLPHPSLGEEVAAAVIPRPGATVTAADLRTHARKLLAHYEVPSRWRISSDPLPLNAAGKVSKRDIVGDWSDQDSQSNQLPTT